MTLRGRGARWQEGPVPARARAKTRVAMSVRKENRIGNDSSVGEVQQKLSLDLAVQGGEALRPERSLPPFDDQDVLQLFAVLVGLVLFDPREVGELADPVTAPADLLEPAGLEATFQHLAIPEKLMAPA